MYSYRILHIDLTTLGSSLNCVEQVNVGYLDRRFSAGVAVGNIVYLVPYRAHGVGMFDTVKNQFALATTGEALTNFIGGAYHSGTKSIYFTPSGGPGRIGRLKLDEGCDTNEIDRPWELKRENFRTIETETNGSAPSEPLCALLDVLYICLWFH